MVRDAEQSRRQVEGLVAGMGADLQRLPAGGGAEADPVASLASAARALVRDQRERMRLLRGFSPLVDALKDAVELVASKMEQRYGTDGD